MDRIISRGVILAMAIWALTALPARAVEPSVRLVGPVGQVQTGTIWPIEVHLDTGGININAVELHFMVIGEGTEITRLGRESSILTLWPETPTINAATAKFVGGRPGGVVAVDAIVGTIFVVARQAGPVKVALIPAASGLYRHDGAGTKVNLSATEVELQVADDLVPSLALISTTHPDESSWGRSGEIDVTWVAQPNEEFSYRLANDIGIVPDDDLDTGSKPLRFSGLEDGIWYFTIKRRLPNEPWSPVFQRRFLLDQTPPETFDLVRPEPRTVGGRDVITWHAFDRTAGVTEYRAVVNGASIGPVESPLTLHSEWRGKQIEIVAIDAAGNQRTSAAWVYGQRRVAMPWWGWTVLVLVSFGLAYGLGRIFRRR